MLEIGQGEVRAGQDGAEPGIVQPSGMAHHGGQHRASLALRPVEVASGSAGGDALAGLGIGLHGRQGGSQVVGRGGDDAAQLGHGASLDGQTGDVDQQAAQQLAGGVGPVGVRFPALDGDQHVGEAGGAADHVGGVGIEGVEPVQRVGGLAGDAEGIDQDDELAQLAAGAGGDGEVLALEVQHEGGAGIGQQVGDDGADALAGPGRGAGQDVAVLAEPGVATARGIGHEAEHEGVGGCRRGEVTRAEGSGAELRRAVGVEHGGREQGGQEAAKRLWQQPTSQNNEQGRQRAPEGQGDPSGAEDAGGAVEQGEAQEDQGRAEGEADPVAAEPGLSGQATLAGEHAGEPQGDDGDHDEAGDAHRPGPRGREPAVAAMAVCASEGVARRTAAGSPVRNQVTPRRCPARARRARYGHLADGAGVCAGDRLCVLETGQSLPVPEHLVEPEAGGAERDGDCQGKGGGKGEHDRLASFAAGAGLAGEGAAPESGPLLHLLLAAGRLAEGEQRAIEGVGVEVEEAGLFDQAAGLDHAAGAGLALGDLELGFLLGELGFLLFVRLKALSERTCHGLFPRLSSDGAGLPVGQGMPRRGVKDSASSGDLVGSAAGLTDELVA